MLELSEHQCKLSSINPRAELHGEEPKPACDLKFEAACPSSVLVHFHPELRQMIFKAQENPDLVEQGGEDQLTALRFPKLGALKWDWEGSGYTLTIDYGIGGKSDITLGDCKVDGIKLEPMNGGTVRLVFRVIAHPEASDMGKIYELIGQDVTVDLSAPAPASPDQLFKDAA